MVVVGVATAVSRPLIWVPDTMTVPSGWLTDPLIGAAEEVGLIKNAPGCVA